MFIVIIYRLYHLQMLHNHDGSLLPPLSEERGIDKMRKHGLASILSAAVPPPGGNVRALPIVAGILGKWHQAAVISHFGTNIALYVKCSKIWLNISPRGHFKQLWPIKAAIQGCSLCNSNTHVHVQASGMIRPAAACNMPGLRFLSKQ